MTKIFVGNLSYQATQEELESMFSAYGTVDQVSIITDRVTGQPRGFAFVEMPDSGQAATAIQEINGREIKGRAVNVNEARPREERGGGGGRGFGGGGGGRRHGGGGHRGGGGDRW
jgi:RNA recognition motif-containing protein